MFSSFLELDIGFEHIKGGYPSFLLWLSFYCTPAPSFVNECGLELGIHRTLRIECILPLSLCVKNLYQNMKCTQNFGLGNHKGRCCLEEQGTYRKLIFKRILKKLEAKRWTWMKWPRMGSSGGLSWSQWWCLGSMTECSISWKSAQGRPFIMKLVISNWWHFLSLYYYSTI